jgi:hypothetical protein
LTAQNSFDEMGALYCSGWGELMIRRHVHAPRLSVALLAASVFLLTFSFPVKAQTTSGSISGTIENLNTELLNAYDLLTIHTIAEFWSSKCGRKGDHALVGHHLFGIC